jgi:hypothetical protein
MNFNQRGASSVLFLAKYCWAGHLAHTAEKRDADRVLVVKHEGEIPSEDLGEDGSRVLNWILNK